MFSSQIRYALGFHGCDKKTSLKVLPGQIDLEASNNKYDWLGNGIYFWERDPERALAFARFLKTHPERGNAIETPSVIGAVIDLGHCLDIIDPVCHEEVKCAHEALEEEHAQLGIPLPKNRIKVPKGAPKLRELDCAVLEKLHALREKQHLQPYDSVRGVFWEGQPLYDGTVIRERSHVQLCIRNLKCIKGYFIPKGFS